jgi:uncharacterized protein (TIGR03086 family)
MEQIEMTISTDHLNRAFISTRSLLEAVQPDQLGAPTRCASWDVRGLINHFVGSALWGAAVLVGDDLAEEDFVAGDFRVRYDESMQAALAAFGSAGALETTVLLPFGEVTGADLMGMVTGDQFTHGWDLARAIGHPTDLDPELAEALLVMAKGKVGEESRGLTAWRPSGPL